MTEPHLDDEQLSLLLDGVEPEGRAHVEDDACPSCGDRLARLQNARDAVAGAAVVPLPADVVDRLVTTALDAPAGDDVVVPLDAARRRRLTTPPPAWLITAAAAVTLLVGVAGVVRAVDRSSSGRGDASLATTAADESANELESSATQLPATGLAAGAPALDPEVVVVDLADQEDPAALALALDGLTTRTMTTADALAADDFAASEAAPTAGRATGGTAGSGGAVPAAPTTTAAADRARCRAQAEAIGAGRFGALLSTATLRWKGTPAEVLVFRLAEPSTPDAPETRQALVLSRPGCELLADPRF